MTDSPGRSQLEDAPTTKIQSGKKQEGHDGHISKQIWLGERGGNSQTNEWERMEKKLRGGCGGRGFGGHSSTNERRAK